MNNSKAHIMSQLKWTTDWVTGFKDIDEQHQHLVEQVNELDRLRQENDSMQIMQALFDFIASAMNHFSYEEEMLREAAYPLVETRHNMHQNFTDRLISYQDKIFADPTVLDELLPQIDVWLQRHIGLNDKAYVEHVQQSGIYQTDKNGHLVRPSMVVEAEGAFQEDLDAQEAKKKAEQETQEEDAPKGWATGAY